MLGDNGDALRHHLNSCGMVTAWSFGPPSPDVAAQGFQFTAQGHTEAFSRQCIEGQMVNGGAPMNQEGNGPDGGCTGSDSLAGNQFRR